MRRFPHLLFVLPLLVGSAIVEPVLAENTLSVSPTAVTLHGGASRQQLIVSGQQNGLQSDLTRKASFQSATPKIVDVDSSGLVSPVADGTGTIVVTVGAESTNVSIKVTGTGHSQVIDFYRDIVPILSRGGCNSGPCHGKASGQNGFKLSLFGYDPAYDYDALNKEARGRRVFLPDPRRSLLLTKPTGEVPHGGGKRLEPGGTDYQTLLTWIESGMPPTDPKTPTLVSVSVEPSERIMRQKSAQQLIVTAKYSDGSTRDVTRLTAYQSNESAIAAVNEDGLAETSTVIGEAAIMARYMGMIAVCNVAVPLTGDDTGDFYARLPRHNFIDGHVWSKLKRLGITPSQPALDHKFLRRAYIDVIGRLPKPEETRRFLADSAPNKRERLIDHLLQQPEFADFWANKWVDLLRPNAYRVGIKTVLNYDAWIRDSFRKNKPYDQFVRELISAKGSTFHNGAATMFRDRRAPDELTTITSQLFLGIRLECAKCHHHPFEVWAQKDFYSFAAYFARIARKGTGLSPPISGSEEIIYTAKSGSVKHPITGEVLEPSPLFGKAPEIKADSDPRDALAEWMTTKNPFFDQVQVNRVWADLMGRGLVEPVDDLRATNPASNPELLTTLGEEFRKQGYDLKKLIRTITTSYVYGLSSLPNESNVVDTRYYSRHYRRRLRAEVLLDAVSSITQVPEKFSAMPPDSRASEIWTHRIESLFLDAFGRPDPNQDPPCERTGDTTVVQVLHLMNSENLYKKVTSDDGQAAKLAGSERSPQEIVEELYLLVYNRLPDLDELKVTNGLFQKEGINRRQVTEDILWALMNTPEFVFKD